MGDFHQDRFSQMDQMMNSVQNKIIRILTQILIPVVKNLVYLDDQDPQDLEQDSQHFFSES